MTESSPSADPERPWPSLDGYTIGVLVAVLVGFALRAAWVAYAAHPPQALFDPARYAGYARQIAHGKGYVETFTGKPTAYYPPGYPYFLGLIETIRVHSGMPGDLPHVAGYVQAVLGALTAGGAAVVARRLFTPLAGVVAAAIVAIYPNLVFHSATLLSETLYNFCFVMALGVLCWGPRPAGLTIRRLILFSFFFGLAILTRPISLAVLPVLLAVWWLDARKLRTAARQLAVVLGVLVVMIAPWTIRNAIRMDSFVPLSTNTGDNLCIGHWPHATGKFVLTDACLVKDSIISGPKGEVRHDEEATTKGLDYLTGHLSREPWLVWRRAFYMFKQDHDAVYAVESYRYAHWLPLDTEKRWTALADVIYVPVAILGAFGLIVAGWSRRPDRLLLVGSALATVAVPLCFFGDARFKVPVMPLLCISAAGLVALPAMWRGRRLGVG